jgi:hypothetical protein
MASLLPIRQAANEFHVDRTTLHRHIRAGRLRAYRRPMDRRTYVDRDELHQLLTFRPVPHAETVDTRLARLQATLEELRRFRRDHLRADVDVEARVREGRRELEERGAN